MKYFTLFSGTWVLGTNHSSKITASKKGENEYAVTNLWGNSQCHSKLIHVFQKSKEANFSTYLIIVRALPDSLTSLPQDLDIDSLHYLLYIFSYFRCKKFGSQSNNNSSTELIISCTTYYLTALKSWWFMRKHLGINTKCKLKDIRKSFIAFLCNGSHEETILWCPMVIISVCLFSMLFSKHFLWCWPGEFAYNNQEHL